MPGGAVKLHRAMLICISAGRRQRLA